ncbi:MAG: ABC transporter permease [Hyphomicrobiaceae bacterium]|nr:ABC transporter permease [Hyphomicrobiaceae bacterium]
MRLEVSLRGERGLLLDTLSALVALAVTVAIAGLIFAALGADPLAGLHAFFLSPLLDAWSLQEVAVKAAPLILIGLGLSLCYRANVWNIGAEGQFTAGALLGSVPAVLFPDWQGPLVLPAMLILGMVGGMAYAAIPAFLKVRFRANEILTSLMLAYVALLVLDYLVRGPWRDPMGFNFPESRLFTGDQRLLRLVEGTRLHAGLLLVVAAVPLVWFVTRYTLAGFSLRVIGEAPRAGAFAGFSRARITYAVFAACGALAGLAGILEIAGTVGQLRPVISPGYGFAAIIVAFLGRLSPLGVAMAGLVLAVSYIGAEAAQVSIGVSDKVARVIQGTLLFSVLACDALARYRLRLVTTPAGAPAAGE